jgi:tripartite-type tricarboxylate transporter receptor subunit TctC
MVDFSRRQWLEPAVVVSLAGAAGLPMLSWAQGAAKGPVKIIVPYATGAATDTLSRLMAQALGDATGATYIVDNRSGAGTQIGTKAIASAAPDGQTLGFIDTAFAINPGLLGAALPYNTERDFVPISLMATAPLVLIVHSSVPAKTIQEFVTLAKAKPGTLNFGSAGVGSAPHLAGEQLRNAAGVDINHVPYRGGATVLTDLLGGQIQFGFTTVPTMIEHIRAGTVRALAVTGSTRAVQLPDVPSMAESGLAKVDATPFFGLIGPAKLAKSTVEQLATTASAAARSGPLNKRLLELGFVPVGSTADAFKLRLGQEIAKWAAVIKAGNIKPNA